MAGKLHGKDGDLTIGGASNSLRIDNYTLNRQRDLHDTTVYGSTWRTRKPGLKDWSADLSGVYYYGQAQQEAVRDKLEDGSTAVIALQLRVDGSSHMYSGNCHVASDVVAVSHGDMIRWSCSVKGAGPLAYTS